MTRSKSRARGMKTSNLANNSVTSLYTKRMKLEDGEASSQSTPPSGSKTPAPQPRLKPRGFGDAAKAMPELTATIPSISFKDFGGCEDQLLVCPSFWIT